MPNVERKSKFFGKCIFFCNGVKNRINSRIMYKWLHLIFLKINIQIFLFIFIPIDTKHTNDQTFGELATHDYKFIISISTKLSTIELAVRVNFSTAV